MAKSIRLKTASKMRKYYGKLCFNYARDRFLFPVGFEIVEIYKFLMLCRSEGCKVWMAIEFDVGIYFETNDLNFFSPL